MIMSAASLNPVRRIGQLIKSLIVKTMPVQLDQSEWSRRRNDRQRCHWILLTALQGLWMPWILLHQSQVASAVPWEEWWTYEGISGPAFWGLINPEWSMCNRGRRQSPINVDPTQLLFDPNLRPLQIDKNKVT